MIRRRSYAEAIGERDFDVDFVNSECVVRDNSMSRVYISSSSDDSSDEEFQSEFINRTKSSDAVVGCKQRKRLVIEDQLEERSRSNYEMSTSNAFVRNDSLRYYNAKSMEDDSVDDVSRQSVDQIFSACLKYVSNESMHSKKSVNPEEFSALQKILARNQRYSQNTEGEIERGKVPIKVEILNENRTSFHFNTNVEHESDLAEENKDVLNQMNPKKDTKIFDDIFTANDDYCENETGTKTLSEAESNFPIQYVGRNSSRKKKKNAESSGKRSHRSKRVVFKNGHTNVPLLNNITGRSMMYLRDFATTMIELRWRWIVLLFSMSNFIVWLGFALMYYVAAYANGDLEENAQGKACIEEGRTFTGIFTFSVETQVSIGYGEKYPNEECPEIAFILLMEVVVGNAMIGAMVSIVFAKIIRPEKHLEGVGFSKDALICIRDGQLCFLIRVWDVLQKHIIGTQIKGWFVKHRIGSGPLIKPLIFNNNSPFILWPTTLQHVIDEKSPLYDLSAKDLLDKKIEIIITLTGSARSSGLMTQSRTSYMSHEIKWGSRFKEVVSFDENHGKYVIDAKSINSTETIDIPLCSARLLRHFNNALRGGPASVSLPASPMFVSPRDSPRSILASPSWSFKVKNFKTDLNSSLP